MIPFLGTSKPLSIIDIQRLLYFNVMFLPAFPASIKLKPVFRWKGYCIKDMLKGLNLCYWCSFQSLCNKMT